MKELSQNHMTTPTSYSNPRQDNTIKSNGKFNATPENYNFNYKTKNEPILPKCDDGSLLVYWYDAHEETNNSNPYIILFGKTYNKDTNSYYSISIVIRNLERKIYLLPRLSKLKADINQDDDKILEENKELTINMFQEFEDLRKSKFSYIKRIQTKPVVKKYCFELPIPHSNYFVLPKKNIPF